MCTSVSALFPMYLTCNCGPREHFVEVVSQSSSAQTAHSFPFSLFSLLVYEIEGSERLSCPAPFVHLICRVHIRRDGKLQAESA
jgi:hypothetical protein